MRTSTTTATSLAVEITVDSINDGGNTSSRLPTSLSLSTKSAAAPNISSYPTLGIPQCPVLECDINANASITLIKNIDNVHSSSSSSSSYGVTTASDNLLDRSTTEHGIGQIVKADCLTSDRPFSVTYLQCQPNGQWNTTLPVCCAEKLDLSSYRLYFAVVGGAGALTIFTLCVLYCHLLRARGKKPNGKSDRATCSAASSIGMCEANIYVNPYHIRESLYHLSPTNHQAEVDTTYATPVLYSTYLSPSIDEDAYQSLGSGSQKLPQSPRINPRRMKKQLDTADFHWSPTSLKTLGESGFRKLPRAHLSIDHISNRSNDSITRKETLQSRGRVCSVTSDGSSAVTSIAMRKYHLMTSRDGTNVPLTSTTQEEENGSLITQLERESSDGQTCF